MMAPQVDAPLLLDSTMFWNASGGVRRYVCAKRQWMARNTDWRHAVAAPIVDSIARLQVPSIPLPGSAGGYRLPWRRSACAEVLRDARPDLIEAADPYRLAWSALDAARATGAPIVGFCHSNLVQLHAQLAAGAGSRCSSTIERITRRYAAHLYRQFDLVLAPSRAMVAHLHDWGVPAAVHQPLGVDTETFHPSRRNDAWRMRLGLPHSARVLVYTGRFAPEKNLAVLLAAVERLGAPYHLVLIGAGPTRPVGERLTVVPAVQDARVLASMLASCDLFVHAGRQETFGLAALEAMACGLPVVGAACEGMAELLDPTVGRGVASAETADFADAIADVFEGDIAAMGAAARLRAQDRDWNRVLPLLWSRYRELMVGSPAATTMSASASLVGES